MRQWSGDENTSATRPIDSSAPPNDDCGSKRNLRGMEAEMAIPVETETKGGRKWQGRGEGHNPGEPRKTEEEGKQRRRRQEVRRRSGEWCRRNVDRGTEGVHSIVSWKCGIVIIIIIIEYSCIFNLFKTFKLDKHICFKVLWWGKQ